MPQQPPPGLEFKDLALLGAPLRLQTKSRVLDEPAGPGTSGAASQPYEYVTDDGVHVGVAESFVAVTGVRDKVGDVIPAGAFKRTLTELEPKACMGHDWDRPIGFPEAIEEWLPGDPRLPETKVDGTPWPEHAGVLWARTRYNLETEDGRRAYADAKFFGPQRTCWSIGYVPSATKTRHGVDPHTGLPSRFLHDPDLFEYSQVLHGAHPMALGQSIKSGAPDGLEVKVRRVQDSAYWGRPVGTVITPGMRPNGPTARRLRQAGKTPSPNVGVTTEAPKPDEKPKGTRMRQPAAQAAGDAEGLFPEPDSTGRVRAEKPQGKDEQYVADLAMNSDGTLDGDVDDNRDKAFRGLLREGITPNELRSDLENVADNQHNTSNAALEPDEIDDLVEEYQARYDALAKRQGRKPAGGEPDGSVEGPGAEQPADQQDTGQDGGQRAEGGDQPGAEVGGKPAEPAPGKPGAPPPGGDRPGAAGNADDREVGPDAAGQHGTQAKPALRLSAKQKDMLRNAQGDTVQAHENSAFPLVKAGMLKRTDKRGVYTLTDEGRRLRDSLTGGAPGGQQEGTPEGTEQGVGNETAGATPGQPPSTEEPPGDVPADTQPGGQAAPPADPAAEALAAFEAGDETSLAEALGQLQAGGADITNADGTPMSSAEDVARELLSDTDPEQARELLGEWGQRGVPAPDAAGGVATPDAASKVGEGPYTEAYADAIAALDGENLQGLADALEALRVGNRVEMQRSDGTRLRISEGTASLAADVFNDPAGRDRLAAWATAANESAAVETDNNRDFYAEGYAQRTDEELAAEHETLTAQQAELTANGESPWMWPLSEVNDQLAALDRVRAERAAQAEADAEADDTPEVPSLDDTAVITADETAEAEQLGDAAHGVTEGDDGTFEADNDVADRQDRVAGMLTQQAADGLDLSERSDDQLRGDRADVVAELRLQEHLEARRRKRTGGTATTTGDTGGGSAPGNDTPAPGETTTDGPEGPPEPPAPPTRPGVAGAAEDLADALDSGDTEAITRTRARLAASLRRSRSDGEAVAALRALLDAPGEPAPEQLRAAAEAIRAEARARRNTTARNRRAVRRFERERLRSLLGQIEAEMGNRGLDFDTVPEDLGDSGDQTGGMDGDMDGDLPGGTAGPAAGTWVPGADGDAWDGRRITVSGSHYSAALTVYPNGKTRWEWTVTGDDGATVASGSGESTAAAYAQTAVEIALDTQAKLGNLPADAQLPTGNLPTDSSATPADEVAAALDAVRERLTRPGRPVNPITGRPDPLTGTVVNTRAPTRKAFDSAADVRAHLEQQALVDTSLAARLTRVRWDSATLTPGGQFMVINYADRSQPELVTTTHLIQANPRGGMIGSTEGMGKPDLVKLGTLLESMRDISGNSVDWTQPTGEPLREQANQMDFGDGVTGYNGMFHTALTSLALDKLRAGKWNDKSISRLAGRQDATAGVTNFSRHNRVKSFAASLRGSLSSLGYGQRKIDPADKATMQIADGAQALYALGAPDAAAVLLRRRAEELRTEFGEEASTRGAPLLEAMATSMLGAHSPVRSPGDRLYAMRAGERLALATVGDDREVPTFRALSPMRRVGGQYAQPAALFVDEGSGKTYTGTIVTESGRDRLFLTDAERPGYPMWRVELGSNLAVLGADEPVPATREELTRRADSDANVFSQEVLDAAAESLPESAAERDKRKGSAGDGERPPRRTSPRAPRRPAPPAPDTTPVPGQAHLADTQAQHRRALVGLDFALDDEPGAGGFESLEAVREWQSAALADVPADRKLPPKVDPWGRGEGRGLTPEYMQQRVIDEPEFTAAGGAKLSPGGHFIVTKQGLVVHARTGGGVWGMTLHMENLATPTPESAMVVADYLERGRFDGEKLNWAATVEAVKEQGARVSAKARPAGSGLPASGDRQAAPTPGAVAARAALLDLVASVRKPKAADVSNLRGIAQGVDMRAAPNPEAFNVMAVRLNINRYHALGGARVQGDDMLPANSNAGARLAKRMTVELDIGTTLGVAAPLDAVRRLRRVADEIGDEQITDTGGKTFNPAADLRSLAQNITDAWDVEKPSPLGRLLRNNKTGTIVLTRDIEIEGTPIGGGFGGAPAMQAESEHMAEVLTKRLKNNPLRLRPDDEGNLTATFGDTTVTSGTVDSADSRIEIRSDGSIEIRWIERGSGRMRLYLPAGSWDHDPSLVDAPPEGGVTTGEPGAPPAPKPGRRSSRTPGADASEEMRSLAAWAAHRDQAAKEIVAMIGVKSRGRGRDKYHGALRLQREIATFIESGQWDNASMRISRLRLYDSDTAPGFDVEQAQNRLDELQNQDEELAKVAPVPPAIGGKPDQRAKINELMLRLARESRPGAAKKLKGVQIGGTRGGRALAYYTPAYKTLTFKAGTWRAGEAEAGQKLGWFSKSGLDTPEHVVSHEYGHHLHFELMESEPDTNKAMITEVYEALDIDIGQGYREGLMARKSSIVTKVGTYAGTNDKELVAELFAEWWGRRDQASPAALVVGRYLGAPVNDADSDQDTGSDAGAGAKRDNPVAVQPPAEGEAGAGDDTASEPGGLGDDDLRGGGRAGRSGQGSRVGAAAPAVG